MQITSYRVVVGIVLWVAVFAVAGEPAAQQKTPIPDEAAEHAAKKTAGEIYGGRFALAKTAADKSALAADMIGAALKIQNGSADQFVVLKVARDIAVGAGDAPTALSAVKELVQRFDVPALTLPAETLLAAAEQATMTSQRKGVTEAAGPIIEKLAEADEYDLAIRVCEAARAAAQGAREFKLAGEFSNQLPELNRLAQESQAYRDARAVMEANPTEPAANLSAGRYLCFVKGDWERGVPMLALGSDAALKSVALMDLRGADSAEEQAAIGDAWWDVAESKQGEERDTLRLRAGFWYRQAAPKLAGGLASLKVKQRLEELSKLGREPPMAIAPDPRTRNSGEASTPSPQDAAVLSLPQDLLTERAFVLNHQSTSRLIYPIHVPKLSTGGGVLEIAVFNTGDNEGDGGMYVKLVSSKQRIIFQTFDRTAKWKSWSFPVQEQTDWFVVLEDHDSKANGGSVRVTLRPNSNKQPRP